MIDRNKIILTISIILAILGLFLIAAILINSPYYQGFEAELSYLSPDLSENRTLLRESVTITKKSDIKIIFEKKYNQVTYDNELFRDFITNLEVQVWNESEYFSFQPDDVSITNIDEKLFQIKIGELSGSGNYYIYINSDYGVNGAYNIGIGIGRESYFHPIGKNSRRFY
ncbi:hypothetical protein EW093_02965 [Thiospirochaeta perfilievii]|uniref:Uncharacterized protein n=1 Tax=Thiospirochaeta perfilievii TaxID=252967 RepID=A0A5C1Q6L6_9SPIO|nr:hypothetical protein [Thiospirochaeta perfilievii]QEN03703.1 hypothetical protein EW093_02965 [Thiospirochaeta perfilievii]